jgi:hypothetical protein
MDKQTDRQKGCKLASQLQGQDCNGGGRYKQTDKLLKRYKWADWLKGGWMDRRTDRQTERPTYRRGWKTDGLTGRQTLMRLCQPPDGSTSPKYKLLCFITTKKICKEKNALAFNLDSCCHLVLCLRFIPFHCLQDEQTVGQADRQTAWRKDRQHEGQTDSMKDRQTAWYTDRQHEGWTDSMKDRRTNCSQDEQTVGQTNRQTAWKTDKQISRKTNRPLDRQTDRQTDSMIHEQTAWKTDKQIAR